MVEYRNQFSQIAKSRKLLQKIIDEHWTQTVATSKNLTLYLSLLVPFYVAYHPNICVEFFTRVFFLGRPGYHNSNEHQ